MKKNFDYKKIHFIGIGGIGMSALARMFLSQGARVTGSDSSESEIITDLKNEGISVAVGQVAENISDDIDCIIYTLAIGEDNPEFIAARELSQKNNVPMFTYAEMLGKVSADMQTIAVSGTHGKTTTTAMIYSAMSSAGADPNLVVGSLIKNPRNSNTEIISSNYDCNKGVIKKDNNHKTNFVAGSDNIFITEACEYKKSFLNLSPKVLVITNIEADHLDYYKDLQDVQNAFLEMAMKVPKDGAIIFNDSDKNSTEVISKLKNIIKENLPEILNYIDFVGDVPKLKVIGEHNIENAAAAVAVGDFMNLDLELAAKGLANFSGTWRRMEFRGETKSGTILYDDYGHHPTEIHATLKAIHENFPNKNLKIFFQPHLYSRTKTLFDDFVRVFNDFINTDSMTSGHGGSVKLYLLPIYAAREENDSNVSSEKLAEKISGAKCLKNFDEARDIISITDSSDLVLSLGAGDVYQILD